MALHLKEPYRYLNLHKHKDGHKLRRYECYTNSINILYSTL
jgi:hypothetical protein